MQNNRNNKIEAQIIFGSHFGLKVQIHVDEHPHYNTELVYCGVLGLRFCFYLLAGSTFLEKMFCLEVILHHQTPWLAFKPF